jgi:glucokinase
LFTEAGELLVTDSIETFAGDGFKGTADKIAQVAKSVAAKGKADFADVLAIGVASPGVVNSKTGVVIKWGNYGWRDVPLGTQIAELTGKSVYVANDANTAALGEAKFGASSVYQSSIFVTLGTGVGGGIIVDGKMVEGYMSAGAEIGHMIIRERGELCGCGRHGCFECYASATALIRQTKKKMEENCDSKMWEIVDGFEDKVDGRTAFEAAKLGDIDARQVVHRYIQYLAEGLADLVNILRPEAIVLGGGIANEGEALFEPLRKAVDERSYLPSSVVPLKIIGAKLGNKAGIYGAYSLAKDHL